MEQCLVIKALENFWTRLYVIEALDLVRFTTTKTSYIFGGKTAERNMELYVVFHRERDSK